MSDTPVLIAGMDMAGIMHPAQQSSKHAESEAAQKPAVVPHSEIRASEAP
jgi:hypothetical protein